jgi:hypothetical protein
MLIAKNDKLKIELKKQEGNHKTEGFITGYRYYVTFAGEKGEHTTYKFFNSKSEALSRVFDVLDSWDMVSSDCVFLDDSLICSLFGALDCLKVNSSEQNDIHHFYLKRFLDNFRTLL